ncbi:MAG: hypothetical protein IT267_04425 [Saprospiraceae bacterium]|nr:hypothetical protein [Saprospiraceae bacterium]
MKNKLLLLLFVPLFILTSSGKCKKNSPENPNNWTRTFRVRLFFSDYIRHPGWDFRCSPIQELYCANTGSDLMGNSSCLWSGGPVNVNYYIAVVQRTTWFGTIEVLQNGKTLGVVNLAQPNGRVQYDGQAFLGKIPNGNCTLIFTFLEPCFGTLCVDQNHPRIQWMYAIDITQDYDGHSKDFYLHEGVNGRVNTVGLCY